jgi:hypothetical protein
MYSHPLDACTNAVLSISFAHKMLMKLTLGQRCLWSWMILKFKVGNVIFIKSHFNLCGNTLRCVCTSECVGNALRCVCTCVWGERFEVSVHACCGNALRCVCNRVCGNALRWACTHVCGNALRVRARVFVGTHWECVHASVCENALRVRSANGRMQIKKETLRLTREDSMRVVS